MINHKGGDTVIWSDMSYNQPEIDIGFRDRLETEPEEIEEEDILNEFDKTNTFVFNFNGCIL